jgi:hypothetical protein
VSAARPIIRRLAGAGFLGLFVLIIAWPGHVFALPAAVRAALGDGTPGVFVAQRPVKSKSELWEGTFTSDDGTVVRTGVKVDPGWGSFKLGQSVPAVRTPLPGGWWVVGHEVHPRSGNADWAYPAVTALTWTGLAAWAVSKLKRGLLPARPHRAAQAPPPCNCADPSRCEHRPRPPRSAGPSSP